MSNSVSYTVLVRYDEIALKSIHIRKNFAFKLASNIKLALKSWDVNYQKVRTEEDMLFIETVSYSDAIKASNIASKVFGIYSVSPATVIDLNQKMGKSVNRIIEFCKNYIFPGDSITIETKIKNNTQFERDKFISNLKSRLDKEIKINKSSKSIENSKKIIIYIRNNELYLSAFIQLGPGGFPLGTNGKAVCLVSSGIDSPVASWLMMKRGIQPIFLTYDTVPFESSGKNVTKTESVIQELVDTWGFGNPIKFYIIPYGKILEKIIQSEIGSKYTCIFCKRFMLRIANKIVEKEKAQAIITGDNLGQVASQTSWNLMAIDRVSTFPVYRPLISFNKKEIVDLGRTIGTFKDREKSTGSCLALPKQLTTQANVEVIENEEMKIDTEILIQEILKEAIVKELVPP